MSYCITQVAGRRAQDGLDFRSLGKMFQQAQVESRLRKSPRLFEKIPVTPISLAAF